MRKKKTSRVGWIRLYVGPMFSSKTVKLILAVLEARKAGMNAQVFKHIFDTRCPLIE